MASNKPSLAQDLLWRLEALALDLVLGLIRVLPLDLVSDAGGWIFKRLGPLTSAHKVASRNMDIAFPGLAPEEKARLLRDQWENLGRTFVEHPVLDRIINDPSRVELVNGERLEEIKRNGEPVVFISGHFANFEVMSAAIVHSGVTCQITYREANNPYVEARFRESRRRYGVRHFAPKSRDGARELLQAMARGESVALMNDQKFNAGVAAPFFGETVHTNPGPTNLALRFGAPLQPMSVQRVRKARFRVVVHAPIVLERTGDRVGDVRTGVERVNAFIEARVRERPEEWFWVHKRWPNEAYRRDAAA